jgi:hypothetical protein
VLGWVVLGLGFIPIDVLRVRVLGVVAGEGGRLEGWPAGVGADWRRWHLGRGGAAMRHGSAPAAGGGGLAGGSEVEDGELGDDPW